MDERQQGNRRYEPLGASDELAVLSRQAMAGDPAATWSLYWLVTQDLGLDLEDEHDGSEWAWESVSAARFMSLAQFLACIERFERLPLGRIALGRICRSGGFDYDEGPWLLWYARAAAAGDVRGFENLVVGSRLDSDELEHNVIWARRAAVLSSDRRSGGSGSDWVDYADYYAVDATQDDDGAAELRRGVRAAGDGDHESARSAFERAAALGHDEGLVLLALLSDAVGDGVAARTHLERIAPRLRIASLWSGVRAECDGDVETARRWYEHALQDRSHAGDAEDAQSSATIARHCLGAIALREGDVERAEAHWRGHRLIDWNLLNAAQQSVVHDCDLPAGAGTTREASTGTRRTPTTPVAIDFAKQLEAATRGDAEATWQVYLRVIAGDFDNAFRKGGADVEDVRSAIKQFPSERLTRAAVARMAEITRSRIADPEDPIVQFWAMRSAALGDAQAMGILSSRLDHDQSTLVARNTFWSICAALHGDELLAQHVDTLVPDGVSGLDANVIDAYLAVRDGRVEQARTTLEQAAAGGDERALLLLVVMKDVELGEPLLHEELERAAQRSQLASLWQGLRAESVGDAAVARDAYERVISWVAPGTLGDEHLSAWVASFSLGGIAMREGDSETAKAHWRDLTVFDLYGDIGGLCRAATPPPRSLSKDLNSWIDANVLRIGAGRLVVIGLILVALLLGLKELGVAE